MEYTAEIKKDKQGVEYLSFSREFIQSLEDTIRTDVINELLPLITSTSTADIATKMELSIKAMQKARAASIWDMQTLKRERKNLDKYLQILKQTPKVYYGSNNILRNWNNYSSIIS